MTLLGIGVCVFGIALSALAGIAKERELPDAAKKKAVKEFDLKKYLDGLYGKGTERTADDPYHFYDTQWVKKTPDGLVTLIRAFHKGDSRDLQLLGRIDGTEWDPGA